MTTPLPSETLPDTAFDAAVVLLIVATGCTGDKARTVSKLVYNAGKGNDRSLTVVALFRDDPIVQMAKHIRDNLDIGRGVESEMAEVMAEDIRLSLVRDIGVWEAITLAWGRFWAKHFGKKVKLLP